MAVDRISPSINTGEGRSKVARRVTCHKRISWGHYMKVSWWSTLGPASRGYLTKAVTICQHKLVNFLFLLYFVFPQPWSQITVIASLYKLPLKRRWVAASLRLRRCCCEIFQRGGWYNVAWWWSVDGLENCIYTFRCYSKWCLNPPNVED